MQLFWLHGRKAGRMASQVYQHHAWRSWRQKRPEAPELVLEIPAARWRRSDERTYRTLGSHDCLLLRVLRNATTDRIIGAFWSRTFSTPVRPSRHAAGSGESMLVNTTDSGADLPMELSLSPH